MPSRPTPTIIGRYAIYGRIASGGMASVHFGRLLGAAGFSRTVAIKRLHPHLAEDPEFLSTLNDEARLAARINHPNVVSTLDVVSTEGELLVVMEYVRGESLARLLRAEGIFGRTVPLPIVSAIVVGALHGLHAAHEATDASGAPLGIVHRDVSPQNILVGVDGVTRVIDFGIAKAAGRLQTTREGVLKGKLAYMAPEQLARGAEVSRRVDVYAMAAVLWEALVGKPCFRGDGEDETYGLVLAGGADPPGRYRPGLPPGLDEVVMTGLAVDPYFRFASAREMAEALVRVVPPAFPTDVGAWVEDVARDALAQRLAAVAEIERPGIAGAPAAGAPAGVGFVPNAGTRREPGMARDDEEPTVASQPSSLSVETPKRMVVTPTRTATATLSAVLAVGLAAGGVLVGGVATLLLRGTDAPASDDVSVAPGAAIVEPSPLEAPPSSAIPAEEPQPLASSSASAAEPVDASDSPPAAARPAPRPPPPPRRPAPAPLPTTASPLSHDRR